jgi:putative DNA-invertase from lambdoid prophage Rac
MYLTIMNNNKNTSNVRVYLRQPTEKERKIHGKERGLDIQKEIILDYLEKKLGYKIGKDNKGRFGVIQPEGIKLTWYTDRGYGSDRYLENREKGGGRLLKHLETGDWIITSHFDRMFGNTPVYSWDFIFEKVKKNYKGKLIICDMGGDVTGEDERSQIFYNILTTFKDVSSIRRKEVSQKSKTDQKKKNKFLGGEIPFGKQINNDGELVDHSVQKECIKFMKKLRRSNHFGKQYSYRKISEEVEKEFEIKISHEGIRRILNPNIRLKYKNKVNPSTST